MLKSQVDFSVILIIALTWLPGTLGSFNKEEVQKATGLFGPLNLTITNSSFLKIVTPRKSDFNGFVVPTHGLQSMLKKSDQKDDKFFASIATKDKGNLDFFELRRHEQEFVLLISEKKPNETDISCMRVFNKLSNEKMQSVDVKVFQVEGTILFGGKPYYAMLVPQKDMQGFDGMDNANTWATSIIGGHKYKFLRVGVLEVEGETQKQALIRRASCSLFVQKGSTKLESRPKEITEKQLEALAKANI